MEKVIASTGFKGTFAEFVQSIKRDPKFFHTSADGMLMHYRDIAKRAGPKFLLGPSRQARSTRLDGEVRSRRREKPRKRLDRWHLAAALVRRDRGLRCAGPEGQVGLAHARMPTRDAQCRRYVHTER